ncbi:MAG: formyltransferase family protein [Gammaproteobacteria bacterium]|nr:formyltransferase family protein [Gammaproteobacteria bacterium]
MNIFILNTVNSGLDTIDLIRKELNISGIIGLSYRIEDDTISDYVYQKEYCSNNNINFIEVSNYELSNNNDKKKLLELDIDVLIISGWQRLIPKWLIDHCSICAIGSHGSPLGITKGRGRSPQNWALLLGLESFYISIFKVDVGIDSGHVIETRMFSYSPLDNIKTSYYKICLLTSEMIIKALKNPEFSKQSFKEQEHKQAEYFPQRTPNDGYIDWSRSNQEIINFVRALTHPYPGARSNIEGNSLCIWSVIPMDINLSFKHKVGTIVKIFNKGDILIKTSQSYMLIDNYSLLSKKFQLKEGMRFDSYSYDKQMKRIIERHKEKYPQLPISSVIIKQLYK